MASGKKIAIVLFNLGGPDQLKAVKPFLFNLFNDKAIISAPRPIRFLLAKLISARRAPTSQEIYKKMGGRSPILENTKKQAKALENKLKNLGKVKTFISMRYWHPFSFETVKEVQKFNPEKIILIPLYPQFSTTTTGSSLENWHQAAKNSGLNVPTSSIGCFPKEPDFIKAHANSIKPFLSKALKNGSTRILFTAHGLPKKIIEGGDPYAWQVEETVKAVVNELSFEGIDYAICFQSRVGPLEWIGPSTEEEIKRAGVDKVNLVMVPIAFVSEHSETLVELDIDYANQAKNEGIKNYQRAPALGINKEFIKGLENIVKAALDREGVSAFEGPRICPAEFSKCPCQENK